MNLQRSLLATVLVAALATPLAAQESVGFIVKLGRDTTAAESYTRTAGHLVVEQVGRAPRVLTRHFEYEMGADGATTRASGTITNPLAEAGAPAVQKLDATFAADSLTMESRRDTSVQRVRLARPPGLVATAGATQWSVYDQLSQRFAAHTGDSLRVPLYSLGGTSVGRVTLHRLGRDSVAFVTDNDRYHAHVDAGGRIQHVVPIRGTVWVTVDRVAQLDLPALTASFAAREKQGAGLGALSTRDTVVVPNAAGASLWIDYGRPSKRGRVIFGNVVAWGQVWRTGANAATQLRTDKALAIGGATVPAGLYTLFSIPSPAGWKLIVNSETGITGTARKAEKDLFTLDMQVTSLTEPVERFTIRVEPTATGGTLHLEWDTTRASIPFTVNP